MKLSGIRVSLRILLPLVLAIAGIKTAPAQAPPSDEPPANVAGKWAIYSTSDDGKTATKYIELEAGWRKTLRVLQGSEPVRRTRRYGRGQPYRLSYEDAQRSDISFHVDGDRMRGPFGVSVPRKGHMHGDWEARRSG